MTRSTRTYPAYPLPAVGAIIVEDEHVLLIRRGNAPAKGKWTIPGGVVEVGETPENALVREIMEECHLDIQVADLVEVSNKIVRDEHGNVKYHYIILDYLARCHAMTPCHERPVHAGSDVSDVCWVPVHELMTYDLTEGLSGVINAAMALNTKTSQ